MLLQHLHRLTEVEDLNSSSHSRSSSLLLCETYMMYLYKGCGSSGHVLTHWQQFVDQIDSPLDLFVFDTGP